MQPTSQYELSASYMNGLVKSVRDAGFLDAVLATLGPDLQSAYARPALKPWWDARFFEQLVYAVGAQFGDQAIDDVGYGVICDVIGAQAMPAVKSLLAAPGAGPATLLSHLEQFISLAVRPLNARWTPLGADRGRLEIHYPQPVRHEIQILWRGAVRYLFEVSGREGKIDGEREGPEPGLLSFEVSWLP